MGQDGAREQSKGATWAGNKGMAWGTHPPGIRGAGREVWDLGSMWGGVQLSVPPTLPVPPISHPNDPWSIPQSFFLCLPTAG